MSIQVITLDSPELVTLPAETIRAVGLHAGSRIAVSCEDGAITLRPLLADSLCELRGIFTSETDLVAELQEERRQDKW